MLLKKLSLATLACLFASGCIITDADDDGASDTEVTTSPTTETPTTETPTTETTTDTPTTSTSTTGDPDTDGTTGEPGAGGCGWGPIAGNEKVPNGYQCGIDGTVDPDGMFPIDCSPNSILEAGRDCTEANVTAEGCCDANGDVWYCVDTDDGFVVQGEDCGDPAGTDTDATDTDTDTDATATDGGTDTDTDTDAGTDTAVDTDGTTTGK